MYWADFTGNALFSIFAVIHFQPLPFTLSDEFSMDMMNISGLFSRYKVCSFSDSLYKTTASKIFSELTGKLLDFGVQRLEGIDTCDPTVI